MSLTKNDFESAKRLIESGERFIISVHTRPDPDAIGSALALARCLRQMGKKVVLLSEDKPPEACAYLPDIETVVTSTSERDFDLGIICDADDLNRIGSSADTVKLSKSILLIDHHKIGEPLNRECLCLRDETAAATAEIVFELLHQLHVIFDQEIARQLMAGMVGDTGGFRFANVTPNTLEIASRLAAYGASPSEAAREIYENRSLGCARILGHVLLNARMEDDGRIIWSHITQEDFAKFNASDEDTDSIVNQLRGIKGARIAILFRETAPDVVRVSLRSRDGVDVNAIASAFGGGGHISAAGCTIEKSLDEAEKALLSEVRKWMAS